MSCEIKNAIGGRRWDVAAQERKVCNMEIKIVTLICVNFLSGMFNLVPHVKFLICIHFKHVSGVNQV